MMKRKKNIILIISLVLTVIVGIISYNLFRKEISTQQVKGSLVSNANNETIYTNIIELNPNGGTGGTKILYYKGNQIYLNEECTQPLNYYESINIPTKFGYQFKGYVINDGENPSFLSNGQYSAGSPLSNMLYENPTEKIELIAVWEGIQFTINFDANGGENEPSSMTVIGPTGTLTSKEPTRMEYQFDGWATKTNPNQIWCISGGNYNLSYLTDEDYEEDGSINLIAVWSKTAYSYRIVLRSDDASDQDFTKYLYVKKETSDGITQGIYTDFSCDLEYEISNANNKIKLPIREGYIFDGYIGYTATIISSEGTISEEIRNGLLHRNSSGDYTTTAQWIPAYTLKFEQLGGIGGTTTAYITKVGTDANIYIYNESNPTYPERINSIKIPNKTDNKFLGYKLNTSDEVYSFDQSGAYLSSRNISY